MDQATLLKKLKDLWETKWLLEMNGPNSTQGMTWLADVRAHLELANPKLAAEFAYYMKYVVLRLSSYTLGPIWTNLQGILRTAITTIEATIPSKQEKVYGPGDAMDVYRDLSEIVSTATKEVFVADPYADQEIFDLYLSKINQGVKIRLLTKPPTGVLKTLVAKFLAKPGTLIEARSSTAIHDRVIFIDCIECWVIGQSIKDAAMKKPTYLLPVAAVSDMQRLYEDAWNTATLY